MLRDAAGEAIAVAPLAREFSVSRAHTGSIRQVAAAMGMLARTPEGGDYRLEPRFKLRISRIVAALLQHHIYAMDRALARCAAGGTAPEQTLRLDLGAILAGTPCAGASPLPPA